MTVLVINHEEGYLEKLTLTKEEEKRLELVAEDVGMLYDEAENILDDHGYDVQDPCINYMVGEDIPIYVENEASIPVFTI